jgi:radical SAM protein
VIAHTIYKPQLIFWETTKACPLACRHCRAEAIFEPFPGELTTKESFKLLDEIAQFPKPYPVLILTGGDVLMRSDLESLLKRATELGIKTALSPAVSGRIDESLVAMAKRYGVHSVSLSLDWADAKKQDEFRGKQGVFDESIRAIKMFSREGIPLQINTTVFEDNAMELPKILSMISGLGVRVWEIFFLIRIGRGETLMDLSAEKMEEVNNWLFDVNGPSITIRTVESPIFKRIELSRGSGQIYSGGKLYRDLMAITDPKFIRNGIRVQAGHPGGRMRTLFVGHDGSVLINGFIEQPLGNVKNTPLLDICTDNDVLTRLEEPWTFGGKCGYCSYNSVCGGSRARSFTSTGDLFASDPACNYIPERRERKVAV